MQNLQILVALLELAELHQAAWTFCYDNVSAGGFEILVFLFEDFCGGIREIKLEGAGTATAHGGVGSRQIRNGLLQQGLRLLVNALATVKVAGGVIGYAQFLVGEY